MASSMWDDVALLPTRAMSSSMQWSLFWSQVGAGQRLAAVACGLLFLSKAPRYSLYQGAGIIARYGGMTMLIIALFASDTCKCQWEYAQGTTQLRISHVLPRLKTTLLR